MIIAVSVTHNVPAMKGAKPNSPASGFHVVPSSRAPIGFAVRIGQARITNATTMINTSPIGSAEMAKNNRLARRSTDRRADGRGVATVMGMLPTN